MWEFFKNLTSSSSLLHYGGLALLLIVVFAETGLLIGFFLPGDYLLFLAGMICATEPQVLTVNIYWLITLMSVAAIIGNFTGYWFGWKIGPALYKRKDTRLFKKRYLESTQVFYEKYGAWTLILGRFLPYVRTFAPVLAGVIKIHFGSFVIYSVVGGVAWVISFVMIGYKLGTYKWVQDHVVLIVIGLVVVTTLPLFFAYLRNKKRRNKT
jgi:membrane-associated protein